MTASASIQSGCVTTEGDDLYYEVRGEGRPLLMIPPAGGDGWLYSYVADILADDYRVIVYDRRANARSTMNQPQNFEISQQSRDAVAVLRAAGEQSAVVFGNSSGAVIALDMARTQPQAVRAVLAHEAPLARLHPKAQKWQRFFAKVYMTAFRFGSSLAVLRFMLGVQLPVLKMINASRPVNQHRKQSVQRYLSDGQANDALVKLELLPITNYMPDIDAIKHNNVRTFIGVSQYGLKRKAWYAQVAQILAESLDSEMVTFPGHHGAFLDMPEEFATTLRNLLRQVES
jgi:pimeloyl-ACP methyl ester carboxylesterase